MNDGRFEVAHPPGAKYVREFFHEEGAELIGKMATRCDFADGGRNENQAFQFKRSSGCPGFLGDMVRALCHVSADFAKASEPFKSKGVVFIAVNRGEERALQEFFAQPAYKSHSGAGSR